MLNVNFEAMNMEEKYYEILRHYVNPNDCATVVQQLLNLHSVSGDEVKLGCDHPRSKRTYIGNNLLKCGLCGEEFK
jgi:hypothetical protein